MKKFVFAAAFACLALLISCEKQGVNHTGDLTGNIYGIWALDSKTTITKDSNGKETPKEVDYSSFHFFISLSEPRLSFAKKGSLTQMDLKDVDVDFSLFSYNMDKKQISFDDTLWLSEGLYDMKLSGTFDILELSDQKLVIQKEVLGVKTRFSFHRSQ